jgi:hypothetical protein
MPTSPQNERLHKGSDSSKTRGSEPTGGCSARSLTGPSRKGRRRGGMKNQRIESVSIFFVALCKPLIYLVDLVGIEPTTSSMPWKRAPSCATGPLRKGKLLVGLFIFAYLQALVKQWTSIGIFQPSLSPPEITNCVAIGFPRLQ